MPYDPLAYVDQSGAMLSQVGRRAADIAGTFFQQNEQWKKFKANQASDTAAKQKVYSTALSILQERGIDPNSVNIPAPSDDRESVEDYTAKFAKQIEPLFIGKGNKLSGEEATKIGIRQQPGVAANVTNQIALEQADPMGQIDFGGAKVSPQGPSSNIPTSEDWFAGGEQAPKTDEDILREARQLAIANERKKMEAGVGSAKELYDILAQHDSAKLQNDLQKLKNENERIKLEKEALRQQKEKAGEAVLSSQRAGFKVTDKTGSEDLNALDIIQNPENYSITGDNPYKRTQWSSGRVGGTGGKADTIKDIDTRINMLTNDTKQMLDNSGMPLQGMEQQYETNSKQLKLAQLAKNFIQNKGGESGLSADEAIQEVSNLSSLKDALELYVPAVPMAQYGLTPKPEQILQDGAKYFNSLPRESYEKLRLALENGGSPASILESLRRAGL